MKRLVAFVVLALSLALTPSAVPQQPKAAKSGQSATQGNPNTKVWINTASSVYHCPGTRWYGNTKHGEYMSQKEAQEKGNRPAYGKVCR